MAQCRGERMKQRLVIVGNSGCRRAAFWNAAALRCGWEANLVTYSDLLTSRTRLCAHLSPDAVVRIESAAENWETMKLLLKHGVAPACAEGYAALHEGEITRLEYQRGWIIKPRQLYLGFSRLVQELTHQLERSRAMSFNDGNDIALFFDKPRCQDRLAKARVSVPVSFGPATDYAVLRAHLRATGRLMVKLAHGSGAAGCIALHSARGRVRALTTVAEAVVSGQSRLYCSKRIRPLLDELEIAALVNRLCSERVQVEEWLPKARWQGRNFDLRVVTIGGVPRHTLARVAGSPFTNLTLGNQRGDLGAIIKRLGPDTWAELRDTCARVAAEFPRSFTLGIDVLVRADFRRHAVLEINAFGELLLNQLDLGEDTYTAALSAWERRKLPERKAAAS
jgi:hypothetical protein